MINNKTDFKYLQAAIFDSIVLLHIIAYLSNKYPYTLYSISDVFRPSAEKRATPSNSGGENYRRHRSDYLPVGIRSLSHIFFHTLQGILLEYDQQAFASRTLYE